MRKIIIALCICVVTKVAAQREKTEAYIAKYKDIAIREMKRSGVPAAITLAQGILESQSGESDLVKRSNNHFGIKCKPEWTGKRTYHDDDERGECFRVYENADDSFKDHSDFLKTRAHYAFLFKLDPTDYEGWANGLKKAGYATSPTYPQRLIKLINDYQLYNYKSESQSERQSGSPKESLEVRKSEEKRETRAESPVTSKSESPKDRETEEKPTQNYPTEPFEINTTRVVFVPAGTSLLAIANKYDIAYSRLLVFNDLVEADILSSAQLIYLERKQKKGLNDFHTVGGGETLWSIAQTNAIRLDMLLLYNNLTKDSTVTEGTKLKLKP